MLHVRSGFFPTSVMHKTVSSMCLFGLSKSQFILELYEKLVPQTQFRFTLHLPRNLLTASHWRDALARLSIFSQTTTRERNAAEAGGENVARVRVRKRKHEAGQPNRTTHHRPSRHTFPLLAGERDARSPQCCSEPYLAARKKELSKCFVLFALHAFVFRRNISGITGLFTQKLSSKTRAECYSLTSRLVFSYLTLSVRKITHFKNQKNYKCYRYLHVMNPNF